MDSSSDEDWILRQIAPDLPKKKIKEEKKVDYEKESHEYVQKVGRLDSEVSSPHSSDFLTANENSPAPKDQVSSQKTEIDQTEFDQKDSQSKEFVPRKLRRLDEPAVEIPAIFLTQGEKNHRILNQSRELAQQLDEENEKARLRRQNFENSKKSVLNELNDNGSSFVYTWKADSQTVDNYIRQEQAHDVSVVRNRHFYVFGEAERVPVDQEFALYFKHPHLLRGAIPKLQESGNLSNLIRNALRTDDGAVLDAVVEIAQSVSSDSNSSLKNQKSSEHSLSRSLRSIGARDSKSAFKLKYVHFKNTSVLVRKLVIAFLHHLQNTETSEIARWFFVCSSDFLLNKQCSLELRQKFIGPVFSALTSRDPDIADVFLSLFENSKATLYNGPETSQKLHELQYTFISNLLKSPISAEALTAAKTMARNFICPTAKSQLSMSDISNTLFKMAGRLQPVNKDVVYRCFYELQLLVQCTIMEVYSDRFSDKKGLFRLQRTVLDCKDVFSTVLGSISYSGSDVEEKPRVSTFLGDSYHTLDYLGAVLDKMVVLAGRDLFYETDL